MDTPLAQEQSDAGPRDDGHPVVAAERALWETLLRRDIDGFRTLVSPDAVMICGGLRGTGEEYVGYLPESDVSGYTMTDVITRRIGPDTVLLCYVLRTECRRPDSDLAGTFQVSSVWMRRDGEWVLVFNQDSPVGPSPREVVG